jgi:hypothetical protein
MAAIVYAEDLPRPTVGLKDFHQPLDQAQEVTFFIEARYQDKAPRKHQRTNYGRRPEKSNRYRFGKGM